MTAVVIVNVQMSRMEMGMVCLQDWVVSALGAVPMISEMTVNETIEHVIVNETIEHVIFFICKTI